MNELEEKARFYAQYWGVKCEYRNHPSPECRGPFVIGSSDMMVCDEERWLELKSLQDITEEDAIEVGMILISADEEARQFATVRWNTEKTMRIIEFFDGPEGGMAWKINLDIDLIVMSYQGEVIEVPHNKVIEVIDYLRSKGYALSWNGKSVEQLQELNWIKIKNCAI